MTTRRRETIRRKTRVADPIIVRALMQFGHSAAKAFEIALDYARGDSHARAWVHIVQRQQAEGAKP